MRGLVAAGVLLAVAPLGAQVKPGANPEGITGPFRIVTGISVTQTATNGNTADLQVDLNTDGSPRGVWNPVTTATSYGRPTPDFTGFLGSYYSVQTYGGFGTPARAAFYMVNPDINALEVGETGSTPIDGTAVPAVVAGTPGAYRGTFQHTYAAPGTYTARAGAAFNFNFTNATTATQTFTTGNPVQVAGGGNLSWTSVFRFYDSTSTNTLAFTYSGAVAAAQTVGVTNTAQVTVGTVVGPNPLEIPTAGEIGLLVFAGALAALGLILLRR